MSDEWAGGWHEEHEGKKSFCDELLRQQSTKWLKNQYGMQLIKEGKEDCEEDVG